MVVKNVGRYQKHREMCELEESGKKQRGIFGLYIKSKASSDTQHVRQWPITARKDERFVDAIPSSTIAACGGMVRLCVL